MIDGSACIQGIIENSQASTIPQLEPGLVLRSVAGTTTAGLSYQEQIDLIQAASKRPLELTFTRLDMSEAEASKAMAEIDTDGDGTVDYVEFEEWWNRQDAATKSRVKRLGQKQNLSFTDQVWSFPAQCTLYICDATYRGLGIRSHNLR
jgi:hypothetical protein